MDANIWYQLREIIANNKGKGIWYFNWISFFYFYLIDWFLEDSPDFIIDSYWLYYRLSLGSGR